MRSNVHVVYGYRLGNYPLSAYSEAIVKGFGRSDKAAITNAKSQPGYAQDVTLYFVRSNGDKKEVR